MPSPEPKLISVGIVKSELPLGLLAPETVMAVPPPGLLKVVIALPYSSNALTVSVRLAPATTGVGAAATVNEPSLSE